MIFQFTRKETYVYYKAMLVFPRGFHELPYTSSKGQRAALHTVANTHAHTARRQGA